MLFHSNGPMHRLKASLLNGSSKMNQLSITKKHKEKTDETHLSGRTLRGEIKMERGPCTSEAINQNGAEILYQNGKLTATSSPKQRLIDKILARRKVEQFFKEEEHHAQNRKLEEVKESLKKELFKHQLQKSHLEGEFIIPSCKHDHPGALQARIVEIRNNLPAMEDRIQKLRLRVSKDHEKKVISHNEDSVHEGAEPYQIRNINMVQLILNDMVEKLMDDYIQKVPGGMDSSSADNLAQKNMQEAKRLMKEVKTNRVTSLVMEQIVLEVGTVKPSAVGAIKAPAADIRSPRRGDRNSCAGMVEALSAAWSSQVGLFLPETAGFTMLKSTGHRELKSTESFDRRQRDRKLRDVNVPQIPAAWSAGSEI
ncbi:uncharacterized protein LOC129697647 isoform X1 [Leucoraja erinacea]|uniref:uncharacterized protein LOC129697647 isoform X1 n=1 Tax=Leucoraja erinaceus TaxID=7782 RepID=UPI0024538987|nr:uncharacterized protein LOC129697647 isoform X1 [Leucoraja erinacea]